MILELIQDLQRAGLQPTAEEVADILWLSAYIQNEADSQPQRDGNAASSQGSSSETPPRESEDTLEQKGDEQPEEPQNQQKGDDTSGSELFLPDTTGEEMGKAEWGGEPFRAPSAAALPGKLALARALRPLKRRINSRLHHELNIDETVRLSAESQTIMPVDKPTRIRWLDLILVVDEWSSMVIWQQTIAELRRMLAQQGAFRNLVTLGFVTDLQSKQTQLHYGTGPGAQRHRPRKPEEFVDPSGETLVLVISDCVSPAWYNGQVLEMLNIWNGRVGKLALLQMLPERLWNRTSLRGWLDAPLRARQAGLANRKLDVDWPRRWRRQEKPTNVLKVPVITLEPESLQQWALLMAGNGNLWVNGRVLLLDQTATEQTADHPSQSQRPTPKRQDPLDRLEQFWSTASPTARKLAGYLAAAPLSLPTMRLVQQTMVKEARQVHLAEVFLSGLFKHLTVFDPDKDPDDFRYDFLDDTVRKRLLEAINVYDRLDVLEQTTSFINSSTGQTMSFQAILAQPSNIDLIEINETSQPFAFVTSVVLESMGVAFSPLAARFREITRVPKPTPNKVQESTRVKVQDSTTCKARVLVVDNDPRTAELHRKNLERWGYEPIVAEGYGEALLRDAQRKAYEHACHVALLEIHLLDRDDRNDTSGLQLLPKLKPTIAIIVTGSGDDRQTTLLATKTGAFDIVGKEEPLGHLKDAIAEAAKASFACNYGPEVSISRRLLQLISDSLAPRRPEQVKELFKHLFPDAKRLKIETLTRSTRPLSNLRSRCVVLLVTVDNQVVPFIVKLSSRDRQGNSIVKREYENYQRYIHNRLPGGFYSHSYGFQELWHVAGSIYNFLGASPKNFRLFSDFYAVQPHSDICDAVRHLFVHTWGQIYSTTQAYSDESLFNTYSARWGKNTWIKRLIDYSSKYPAKLEQSFVGKTLDDPVHWIVSHTNLGQADNDASALPSLQIAVTHGDLLGDNFFVDRDNYTWAIDYEHTSVGPIFRDFVTLESDIILRLAKFSTNDIQVFRGFVVKVLHDDSWTKQEFPTGTDEFIKAYAVVSTLRETATQFVQSGDRRAYYWGLLLNVAFRIVVLEEKLENATASTRKYLQSERQLAVNYGALICHRLEQWGTQWPPADWENAFEAMTNLVSTNLLQQKISQPIKILFLGANPSNTTRLRLDEEQRKIDQELRKTKYRDSFQFIPHGAVRADDLGELLLRYEPTIVHFSGHGTSEGAIILENSQGQAKPMPPEALSDLFRILVL